MSYCVCISFQNCGCHSQGGHYSFILWLISHRMSLPNLGRVLCEGCLRDLTLEAETDLR